MSIGLGGEDYDTLDMSRRLIAGGADRASRYFGMVLELIEMRDDDGAHAMLRTALSQVATVKTGFSALAEGRVARPATDARTHFESLPDVARKEVGSP